MLTVDNIKYYTLQESAEIAGLSISALRYRAEKDPDKIQHIDGRKYIKAADLKQIIEGKKQ